MDPVPPIVIRRAAHRDASEITRLSMQLGYPVEVHEVRDRLASLLTRSDHLLLVAESGVGLSGWLHAYVHEAVETPCRVQIDGLVVDALCRRQGVGARLIDAAATWAAERGIAGLGVTSNVERHESHPFYEKLGFQAVKTQIAYRKGIAGMDEAERASS